MAQKRNNNIAPKQKGVTPVSAPAATADGKTKLSPHLKLALLLGVIAFAVYANTLVNGYAVDDGSAIIENRIVKKGISAIPELLATPYRRGVNLASNDLYRPLSLVMFAVEYQLFGLNPAPNHFFNILVFAGCVMLLFLFLYHLFERKKVVLAFIAALLFALHPIHTEVVANIKSRDELLCFFFAFLSLNIFVRYIQSGKTMQLLGGVFCFFLSILAKETAYTFVAVVPLVFFFYRNENRKGSIYVTASVIVVAVIGLVIRNGVLNAYNVNDTANIPFIDNALAQPGLPVESRIATAVFILGYYARLLVIPYPLIWDYSYNIIPFVHFGNIWVLLSLVVYGGLTILGIKLFKANSKSPAAFAIFFFLITIALFSNIPFLIGSAMGERFMFFPSVGFCVLVAMALEKWLSDPRAADISVLKSKKLLAVVIPLSLIYGLLTFSRNSDWLDNYTLYSADVSKAPNGAKLNYFVGYELATSIVKKETDPSKQKQIYKDAIDYMRRSLAIYPDYDKAHANLAFAYYCVGQYDSSEVHGARAIALNPDNAFALSNLAAVYNIKKDFPKAIGLYKKAIKISPEKADNYAYCALCYGSSGAYDSALSYCYKAIAVDPSFTASYEIMATTYRITGKPDSARKYEDLLNRNKQKAN